MSVDGTSQTVNWSGGSAPTSGDSVTDIYSFTILKTGNATYFVVGSQVKF
jgi:hypothetical protein